MLPGPACGAAGPSRTRVADDVVGLPPRAWPHQPDIISTSTPTQGAPSRGGKEETPPRETKASDLEKGPGSRRQVPRK